MLHHTFLFLEKINKRKEQQIWSQHIKDWSTFLNTPVIHGIAPEKKHYYDRQIKQAQQALKEDNSSFFINKLPSTETWRIYNYFKDQACFLDIEINSSGKVILVGIHDGNTTTNFFIHGANLETHLIEKELKKYKLIITFNGASFDLPKLQKQLNIHFQIPHIDLKPLCIKLNLKGGLKEIERKLNLKRPAHLYGNPIDLWKTFHASQDQEYLQLLLDYNREDCENLPRIMEYCYHKLTLQQKNNLNKSA
jgi:uncharacterized protein YprB with RNaseH-like and TPR domain